MHHLNDNNYLFELNSPTCGLERFGCSDTVQFSNDTLLGPSLARAVITPTLMVTSVMTVLVWVGLALTSAMCLFFIIRRMIAARNKVWPTDVIRPFSGFEYVFHDIVKVNGSHNLCLFAHFEHRFHPATLEKALLLLQSQHALLHSTVVNEQGSTPMFKHMSWAERQNHATLGDASIAANTTALIDDGSIATLRVLTRTSAEQWKQVLEDEVNSPTAALRGILLRDPSPSDDPDDRNGECDVGLTVRHDIMDGKSIALLYVELIKLYRKLYIVDTQHNLAKNNTSRVVDEIPLIPEIDDTVSLEVPETPVPIPPSLDYYLLKRWPKFLLVIMHFVWLIWMTCFFTVVPWCAGIPHTASPSQVREERRNRLRTLRAEAEQEAAASDVPSFSTSNNSSPSESPQETRKQEGLLVQAKPTPNGSIEFVEEEEEEILPSLWSTRMIHDGLSVADTQALMQLCKDNRVTVGTALFTAAMRTSAEIIFKYAPQTKSTKIWGILLVDLRAFVYALTMKTKKLQDLFDPTSFGIYISSLDFIHTFKNPALRTPSKNGETVDSFQMQPELEKQSQFWAHARESKRGLAQALALGKHLTSAVAYTFFTKYAAHFSRKFASPTPCASFSLSNIGCFDNEAAAAPISLSPPVSPVTSPKTAEAETETETATEKQTQTETQTETNQRPTIPMPRSVNLLTENFPQMRDVHAGVTTGCSFPLPLISTFTYRGQMEVAFSFPRETMSDECMHRFAETFMHRLRYAIQNK
eukprot:TRINITY_DN853_c0_g1_i1.p1 TRINITY_DN853_c0_g1~~TRINITY_DN853_c0_g1_i1.p1  ORF type:complete len:754 (-),score=106.18 TRINITY_DN853_c0_g1_i1:102-2363(-)